jgi:hypothetical protein
MPTLQGSTRVRVPGAFLQLLVFSFDVFTAFIVPCLAFMCDARASFILQS